MPLNELEKAVLHAMCRKTADAALKVQLQKVTVRSRENTGAGFYTKLQSNHAAAPIKDKVIGNVFARVSGLKNPMAFLLFIKDGYANTLEGAATEDSTVDIDFDNAKFEIL